MILKDPSEAQSRIPIDVRTKIVDCLQQAYAEATSVTSTFPMIGKHGHLPMARGNLIYWLANNKICDAVKSGQLAGSAAFKPVENGGAEYMEYTYDGVSITLSRVAEAHKAPRKSNFRLNRAYGNQLLLDFIQPESDTTTSLVLIHGHKDLEFAHFILPGLEDGQIRVLHRSDNMIGSAKGLSIEEIQEACEVDEFGLSIREEWLEGKSTTGTA